MNIREIAKPEIKSTLITMDKIFKENQNTRVDSALIKEFSPEVATQKLVDAGFRFFSAFENGGEMGTLALKNKHICVIAVKKYAQRRGVGTALVQFVLDLFPKGTEITVNADQEAVPFYVHLGFEPLDPKDPVVHDGDLVYIPMKIKVK